MAGHHLIKAVEQHFPNITKHYGDKQLSIIEIGASRGQNSTRELCDIARQYNLDFASVDPADGVFEESSKITSTYGYNSYKELGEKFLETYEGDILFLYLDAFDIVTDHPHIQSTIDSYSTRDVDLTNENAWKMHLEAAQNSYNNVVMNGFICIDDTWAEGEQWNGKGKDAVPFLLENGYTIIRTNNKSLLLQRQS